MDYNYNNNDSNTNNNSENLPSIDNKTVVVFDVWSSFAYFRKPFTTTTALTFDFIPRSAIEGLIGSLIGINYDQLSSKFEKSNIAVGIINPLKKIPFSTMHIHPDFWDEMGDYMQLKSGTKKRDFHSRVNIELLVNPKYRIYFSDPYFDLELEDRLRKHETVFTPYLGTSSMIANFEYIGTFQYGVTNSEIANISTIIPFSKSLPNLKLVENKTYAIEQNIPGHLDDERRLSYSYSAIYNPNGGDIIVQDIEINTISNNEKMNNFVFLPS